MEKLNDFIYQTPRILPVVLLLDTSGSMEQDGKIETLNQAVNEMIKSFKGLDSTNAQIAIAIYTFGGSANQYLPLCKPSECGQVNLEADGMTPLGAALNMAKTLIEDKTEIDSRSYRPIVVLVSDGMPNDDWEVAFNNFKNDGRTSKCCRMAMGIGVLDATPEYQMLCEFVSNEEKVFTPKDTREIMKFFNYVTMSVGVRSHSQNPNITPTQNIIELNEDDDELFSF